MTTTAQAQNISWQERAIAAYHTAVPDTLARVRGALVARIAALTAHDIADEAIYVNAQAQTASVTVEGVMFRLRQHELMIVRPCSWCGVGQFESPTIATLQDIGHALSGWEPRCLHCAEADATNWLDLEA